eukprot:746152-Hanusia_phi.AAC.11
MLEPVAKLNDVLLRHQSQSNRTDDSHSKIENLPPEIFQVNAEETTTTDVSYNIAQSASQDPRSPGLLVCPPAVPPSAIISSSLRIPSASSMLNFSPLVLIPLLTRRKVLEAGVANREEYKKLTTQSIEILRDLLKDQMAKFQDNEKWLNEHTAVSLRSRGRTRRKKGEGRKEEAT